MSSLEIVELALFHALAHDTGTFSFRQLHGGEYATVYNSKFDKGASIYDVCTSWDIMEKLNMKLRSREFYSLNQFLMRTGGGYNFLRMSYMEAF